jgi:hypothetical protein
MPTLSSATPAFTSQSLDRWLAEALPDSVAVEREPPIELSNPEPPRLSQAIVLEGRELEAKAVDGAPVVAFAAFLDGRQFSETKRYLPGGVPLVLGSVGAAIRERRDRRLFTWRHRIERGLYVSRAHITERAWQTLRSAPMPVRDTSDGDDSPLEHPLALREAALQRVQHDRERVEESLARSWCDGETRPLLIDGGINGTQSVARSRLAVGVVKSHRTLHARGDALKTVLALGERERSSVFAVTSEKRERVASWYLRLHDPAGHDPMWGLVRVETAIPDHDIGARADEVSRWILAEARPVALPDTRWDKMVYGVRDCEEFLRAVM